MDLTLLPIYLCIVGAVVSWLYESVNIHKDGYEISTDFNRKTPISSAVFEASLSGGETTTFCGVFWATGFLYLVFFAALGLVSGGTISSLVGWAIVFGLPFELTGIQAALVTVEGVIIASFTIFFTAHYSWKGIKYLSPKVANSLSATKKVLPSEPKWTQCLKDMYKDHKEKYCKIVRSK
jgi:hypothetical protein